MLTVTERAKVTLAQLKMQSKIEDVDVGLRLSLESSAEASPGPGVFGLWADREAPGDHVVEYGGTKVLLVEEELAAALADATIDAQQTGQGDDLFISRPGRTGTENGKGDIPR